MTQVTQTPRILEDISTVYSNITIETSGQMVEEVQSTKATPEQQYLGDLISGTYCSRIFSDCDRNKCRLQSPNFPGLYPRNLTCYYAVSRTLNHIFIFVDRVNSIKSTYNMYSI